MLVLWFVRLFAVASLDCLQRCRQRRFALAVVLALLVWCDSWLAKLRVVRLRSLALSSSLRWCFSVLLGDGSRKSPRAAECVAAVACSSAAAVCVSVWAVGLLGGWKAMGWFSSACPAVGSCCVFVLLMTSKSCLLYFSGRGIRRIVLARTTLLAMPRSVSPVVVSLPSQIAG